MGREYAKEERGGDKRKVGGTHHGGAQAGAGALAAGYGKEVRKRKRGWLQKKGRRYTSWRGTGGRRRLQARCRG